jgi:hypothetical protein
MILENFGSIIEAHYYDRRHKRNDNEYMTTCNKFLQIAYDKEPVLHRYLRIILFRMKFKLRPVDTFVRKNYFWMDDKKNNTQRN